jgi:hypothetical protein
MAIFARRTIEFDPASKPVIGFNDGEACRNLLTASSRGDLLLLVGSTHEQISDYRRGALLGLAEFGRNPIPSLEEPRCLWGPIYLQIERAWSFDTKLKLIDTLTEHLSFSSEYCVRLSEQDGRAVLELPRDEITLRSASEHSLGSQIGLATTGPKPTDWSGLVTRDSNRETWTYILRFGCRDVWKVGQTQDIARRLEEVNQHIPREDTGECWTLMLATPWGTAGEAYAMEQALLAALGSYRSVGERVRCPEAEIQRVWMRLSSAQ